MVPANNKWYRGLTKLTVAGNRSFESASLQRRVRERTVGGDCWLVVSFVYRKGRAKLSQTGDRRSAFAS
jgi:hypothetical protein